MAFDSADLVTSAVARVRLQVGDIDEWEILEDSVYEFFLAENSGDEIKAAIEALETIINYYSLNPTDETFGQISGSNFSIKTMEGRLKTLREKLVTDTSGNKRVPLVLRSDRKSWSDFNKLFGEN